jgi:hypothetical protein
MEDVEKGEKGKRGEIVLPRRERQLIAPAYLRK